MWKEIFQTNTTVFTMMQSSDPSVYGYLEKMGRNGKWQKRFFETDGESLSYYKNENEHSWLLSIS
jgi:hypothetical protein